MLVLKRNQGEALVFLTNEGRIEVTVGKDGKLAIDCPRQIKILRKELEQQDAARRKQN